MSPLRGLNAAIFVIAAYAHINWAIGLKRLKATAFLKNQFKSYGGSEWVRHRLNCRAHRASLAACYACFFNLLELLLQYREIILSMASINHGRIYFPTSDAKFFPSDSFGDRAGGGHKGQPVTFVDDLFTLETDIRVSSGLRFSPRRSFNKYFTKVTAMQGALLRVVRTDDRLYQMSYVGL